MFVRIGFFLIGLMMAATVADAATTSLALNLMGPPVVASTTVTCTDAYPTGQTSFAAPLAAGTTVATCTVAPTNWVGTLALGGTDAASFSISGMTIKNIAVLGSGMAAGTSKTYNVTVTSTP